MCHTYSSYRFQLVSILFLSSLLSQLSFATSDNKTITATDCALAFGRLELSLFNFDRYEDFFAPTSTMTLAEAGVFTGPDNIREYVQFAHPTSPYIETVTIERSAIHPVGFDAIARTCTFVSATVLTYGMSPRYSIPINVTTSSAAKITFDYTRNIVDRVHIFYTVPWLKLFFDKLVNTHAVKRFICHTMATKCKRTYVRNGATSITGCIRKLDALPIFSDGRVDGFDFGCRSLHAVFARVNSAHCAHISFFDQVDPDGKIKCQTSQTIQVSDLYSQEEINLYRSEVAKAGVDPDIGYRIECVDSSVWTSPLGDGTGGCNWVAMRPKERCAVDQADVACRKTCSPLCV